MSGDGAEILHGEIAGNDLEIRGEQVTGELVDVPLAPWDQAPGEEEHIYGWFLRFRDMGRDRTIARTATIVAKSPQYLQKIAANYRWVARARAFDAEIDRQFSARTTAKRIELAERHARIADKALAMVERRLDDMDVDELTMLDIGRWLDVASKMERFAWGRAEQASTKKDLENLDVSMLDETQRKARLLALKHELEKRLQERPDQA